MSNQTAEEFLKDYEESLIEKVGEEDWERKKVYDVGEVVTFLNTFTNQRLTELAEEVRLPIVNRDTLRKRLLEDPNAKSK